MTSRILECCRTSRWTFQLTTSKITSTTTSSQRSTVSSTTFAKQWWRLQRGLMAATLPHLQWSMRWCCILRSSRSKTVTGVTKRKLQTTMTYSSRSPTSSTMRLVSVSWTLSSMNWGIPTLTLTVRASASMICSRVPSHTFSNKSRESYLSDFSLTDLTLGVYRSISVSWFRIGSMASWPTTSSRVTRLSTCYSKIDWGLSTCS
jgi:hypothetical protein